MRPDALHEVDARGNTVLIGFIEAESEMGAALNTRIDDEIVCVPARQVARWRAALGPTPNEARVVRWLTKSLLHRKRAKVIHPGVRRVLIHLRGQQAVLGDLSLKTLAGIAGVSPSRLMHAFTESVGVPVRPYILWLRLQRAASELTGGASVTSAAHRAGFSDAAHLTRTFRRMLGLRPSDCVMRARLTVGLEPTMDNHTAKADTATRINAARQFGADEIRVVSSTRLGGPSGPPTISGERSLTPTD